MTQRQLPSRRVAYLLKRFPRLSETFILHEILELERQGLDLHLFSIMNPGEEMVHADVARVRAPVTCLPAGWPAIGAMRPAISLAKVLLPLPLAPSRPTRSSASSRRSRSCSTGRSSV